MIHIQENVKDANEYKFKYLSFLYSKIYVQIPFCKNKDLSITFVNLCYKNVDRNESHLFLHQLNMIFECNYYKLYNQVKEGLLMILNLYEGFITIFPFPIAEQLFKNIYDENYHDYNKKKVDINMIKETKIIAYDPYKDITDNIRSTYAILLNEFIQSPIKDITNYVSLYHSFSGATIFTYDDEKYKFISKDQCSNLTIVVNNYDYDKYKLNFDISSTDTNEKISSSYMNDIEKSCDTIKLHYSQLLDQKLLEYKEHQISSYNKFNDLMKYLIKNERLDDCQLRISNDI
jgi:hypothetical protein